MNTSPINFGLPNTGVTRANLNQGVPPGANHGVSNPQDTVAQGQFAAPPVIHVPPGSNEATEKRRMPRWAMGLLGLTMGIGATMAVLGPAQSGVTHHASEPAAAVTVQHGSKADLKTEVQKAQSGVALESSRFNTSLSTASFGESAPFVELKANAEHVEANGFSFDVSGAELVARGGGEAVTVYDSREGQMPDYLRSFLDEGEENWSIKSTVRPAGGVATLASIAVTTDQYTGGSPNQSAELMTFNHVAGERVLLSDLLNGRQQAQVLNSVSSQLQSVPAGSLFQHDNLGEIVNRSFAVRDTGGKDLKLVIAVPGNNEANEGKVAEFTFSVPRDILK